MATPPETTTQSRSYIRNLSISIGLCIIAFLIGLWAAYYWVTPPAVGIIHLNSDIYSWSAEFVSLQIEEARENPQIKAVVFQIDSPGGVVTPTQELYLELLELRRMMPVVSSIDGLAASGGYYLAMGTDPIFAKPSSTIGNVGVWGYAPIEYGVNDVILASGPFKLTASNRSEFLLEIESIKQEFLFTVLNSRGDRLVISLEDLSQGLTYLGRQALELGLIDELGGQTEAIERAAELAHIGNYEVIDLETVVIERLLEEEVSLQDSWIGAADELTGNRILPPGIYLLYDVRFGGAP